jgi:hypothetical protein
VVERYDNERVQVDKLLQQLVHRIDDRDLLHISTTYARCIGVRHNISLHLREMAIEPRPILFREPDSATPNGGETFHLLLVINAGNTYPI